MDYFEVKRYSSKDLDTNKVLTELWTQKPVTLCDAKEYINNWITVDNVMDGFQYFDDGENYMTELQEQRVRCKFLKIINKIKDEIFDEYERDYHDDNYQSKEDLKYFGLFREDDDDEGVNLFLEAVIYDDSTIEVHWNHFGYDFDGRYRTADGDGRISYMSMV